MKVRNISQQTKNCSVEFNYAVRRSSARSRIVIIQNPRIRQRTAELITIKWKF